jgi:hypothetical protein
MGVGGPHRDPDRPSSLDGARDDPELVEGSTSETTRRLNVLSADGHLAANTSPAPQRMAVAPFLGVLSLTGL